ncbi:MAG TPA: GGDEF domain-containing protein [Burkholderiaceae bacterium]|nr:GGDEF domain-containing protein [Burkholderiaceae bacterium]
MLSSLTPTEIAFVMAGLMQAVPALLWLAGGWVLGDTRRAALQWSAYAASSALSFLFLVAAMRSGGAPGAELLRAAGNIAIVIGLVALQRGIWLFIGRPVTRAGHLLALVAVLLASWVGLDPAGGPIRVGVNSIVQAIMAVGMARDLYRHARHSLHLRWPWVLPLPLCLAALAFAGRGLRALLVPAAVTAEMTVDSSLNIGSAFAYVLLSLSFHAMLMALVTMRLISDLRRLSMRDGLTGLLNRRALEEALAEQVGRSRRSGEAFCVLMLDADHFKQVNDRFGHAVGDQALKHLSKLLQGHMREVDRVARFGGEEFLVLLPGLALADALPLAERLRAIVAAAPLSHADGKIRLSVSIGMAQWSGPPEDASRLVVRADAALYEAKRRGRDRVASAGHGLDSDVLPA